MTWFPFLFVAALYTLNPVTITVYPAFAMPPATFRITVLVPRHFDNRRICYAVVGPEERRSCFTLDGWQARRTWTVYWQLRTAGEYEAEAVLTRNTDGRLTQTRDVRAFTVLGFEP